MSPGRVYWNFFVMFFWMGESASKNFTLCPFKKVSLCVCELNVLIALFSLTLTHFPIWNVRHSHCVCVPVISHFIFHFYIFIRTYHRTELPPTPAHHPPNRNQKYIKILKSHDKYTHLNHTHTHIIHKCVCVCFEEHQADVWVRVYAITHAL